MKLKIAITAAILAASVGVQAGNDHEACKRFSERAEYIMDKRQDGYPMREYMELVKGNEMAENLVMAAYKDPKYRTSEHQQRAVEKFGNRLYMDCLG